MFFFKKKEKQLEETIQQLQRQILELQKSISTEQQKGNEFHFHIQHVDIKDPTLEQLTFSLESLDIEELSGALNVGNNFGVSVDTPEKKQQSQQQNQQVSTTKKGYSVSFPTSKEG
ncbi:hypothetical protein [Pontibacillus yanchengensis]|uniref:Uncharacterized protein n=1 Tax=Pontibacillus yanchengensis Y32 TaxID=1385514 RepID=A0A0A2TJ10_9BACI|nr:hypothetical protein [Pontibacillus yanchengensis]KGP74071.1 hypothetical protein N782_17180 [Pontibacillus yanchengensis Y32]